MKTRQPDVVARGLLPKVSDEQLQQWADGVTRQYRKFVDNVVAIGRELFRIKAQCPHGTFERMFKGNLYSVATPIPFGIRAAEMFMAVAAHPILSKANHGSFLPSSYRTLYELSRLPTAVLTKALSTGLIHPEMERQDALFLQESREPPWRACRKIAKVLRRLWLRYPGAHAFLIREVNTLAAKQDEEEEEEKPWLTEQPPRIPLPRIPLTTLPPTVMPEEGRTCRTG